MFAYQFVIVLISFIATSMADDANSYVSPKSMWSVSPFGFSKELEASFRNFYRHQPVFGDVDQFLKKDPSDLRIESHKWGDAQWIVYYMRQALNLATEKDVVNTTALMLEARQKSLFAGTEIMKSQESQNFIKSLFSFIEKQSDIEFQIKTKQLNGLIQGHQTKIATNELFTTLLGELSVDKFLELAPKDQQKHLKKAAQKALYNPTWIQDNPDDPGIHIFRRLMRNELDRNIAGLHFDKVLTSKEKKLLPEERYLLAAIPETERKKIQSEYPNMYPHTVYLLIQSLVEDTKSNQNRVPPNIIQHILEMAKGVFGFFQKPGQEPSLYRELGIRLYWATLSRNVSDPKILDDITSIIVDNWKRLKSKPICAQYCIQILMQRFPSAPQFKWKILNMMCYKIESIFDISPEEKEQCIKQFVDQRNLSVESKTESTEGSLDDISAEQSTTKTCNVSEF